MIFSKQKMFYEMSEQQFKEMEEFYTKLGFNSQQVEKLTKNCFGAEIRVSKTASYSYDWSFWRRRDIPPEPTGIFKSKSMALMRNMMGSVPFASGAAALQRACAAAPVMRNAMAEDCCAYSEESMSEVSAFEEEPEFNTAETRVTKENEEHSPLDKPQLIFSANVNTASWTYLRSRVARSRTIDPHFVRIEELINSYPFELNAPKNDDMFELTTESAPCPWNNDSKLLLVGIKGKKTDVNVKQNLCFLVDVSGSMDSRWVIVQMSMMAVISKLKKGDLMSVISYSDRTTTVTHQLDCGNMDKCIDSVLSIEGIGGCTYGSKGLENAYSYLEDKFDKNANNRVFIFTDGDFNFGVTSEGNLKDLIYKKRSTGIYLSVVGYGENNFKDNKMETLAQNGNGNYTFVSNPHDITDNLWDKLISNLVAIAKDVKISVELNPDFVSEYRLIGYDSRILSQKDFDNTEKAVDAIGSEHNVVALIEYKEGKASQKYSGRYVTSKSSNNSDEFAFIEIRYKNPDGENLTYTKALTLNDISDNTDNAVIASIIATFGLLVKDSEYKGFANKQMLAEMVSKFENTHEADKDEYSHINIIKKYVN
ncbi:MAG: von Willebrand factor type A domain-containing protein [Acutalibacteraceae bacterium]|nr:von Willebrand factor type A domain-containing protein [Acutalibacteraceae bacterium]